MQEDDDEAEIFLLNDPQQPSTETIDQQTSCDSVAETRSGTSNLFYMCTILHYAHSHVALLFPACAVGKITRCSLLAYGFLLTWVHPPPICMDFQSEQLQTQLCTTFVFKGGHMWSYAVLLALIEIYPNTFFPMALYGLCRELLPLFLSGKIGTS